MAENKTPNYRPLIGTIGIILGQELILWLGRERVTSSSAKRKNRHKVNVIGARTFVVVQILKIGWQKTKPPTIGLSSVQSV